MQNTFLPRTSTRFCVHGQCATLRPMCRSTFRSSDRRIRYTSPLRVSEIRFADWCLETDCPADTYRARRLRGRVQVRPPRQQLPLPGHLDVGHAADAHQQGTVSTRSIATNQNITIPAVYLGNWRIERRTLTKNNDTAKQKLEQSGVTSNSRVQCASRHSSSKK